MKALAKSNFGQELKQAKVAEREVMVKTLFEKKAIFNTLHSNEVTPGELSGINTAKIPSVNAAVLAPPQLRICRKRKASKVISWRTSHLTR